MILEFYMVRPGLAPHRANPSDAGLDVYFNPEESNSITLLPGENVVLPTGVKFGIPHGYMLQVMNRSSVAAKKSLVVGAHCIDAGYEGEIFIDIHNVGTKPQTVRPFDKIAQLVLVPVVSFRAFEVGDDRVYDDKIAMTKRKRFGFGSTDK